MSIERSGLERLVYMAFSALIICCADKDSGDGQTQGSDHHMGDSAAITDTGINPSAIDADWDGYTRATDCDDSDPARHPGAQERCNNLDDDCDGLADEGSGAFVDADGDGFGSEIASACDEAGASNTAAAGGDCDETDSSIHPGADDRPCDRVDSNCDGTGKEAAQYADGTPWGTVQEAINAAAPGEVISVCSGRHVEQLFTLASDEVTLRSYDGDPMSTFFDGGGTNRSLTLAGGHVLVEDLGFTGGRAYVESLDVTALGGSIYATGADLEIQRCQFFDNFGEAGGAVFFGWAYPITGVSEIRLTVGDTEFHGNVASEGGADILVDGRSTGRIEVALQGNLFDGSLSSDSYGRVVVSGLTPVAALIVDNTFQDTQALSDGGCLSISPWRDDPTTLFEAVTIQNSTFSNCSTERRGGAIAISPGGPADFSLPVTIDSCTFTGVQVAGEGGTISITGSAPVDVEVANVVVPSTAALGHGGFINIGIDDGVSTVSLRNVAIAESSANGNGGAINIAGEGTVSLFLTDVVLDHGTALEHGSAIASIEGTNSTIRCERCIITHGQAGFEGGAVDIDDMVQFDSVDSDWGLLSSDNSPNDLVIPDYLYRNLKSNETFSCSPDIGCTIPIP